MNWWQTPAFSAGRMAFVVVLTIVTIAQIHEVLR